MALPFEALKLKRGGQGYLVEEFVFIQSKSYRSKKSGEEKVLLRCQQSNSEKCQARGYISNVQVIFLGIFLQSLLNLRLSLLISRFFSFFFAVFPHFFR